MCVCVCVCVCVYSAAISQLLPNYTNGALNRWTTEEDHRCLSQTYGPNFTSGWYTAWYTNSAVPLTAGLCAYERFHFVLRRWFLQPRYISFDYICTDSSEEVGSVGCGFIFAFDFFFPSWFLSTPCCACSLVYICMRMCVRACVLAGLCGCAQTTLCVNSSLAVGGQTPCACVCVCVDWWGHSGVPGLLTTSPSPLSPLDSCSSPPIALFHPRLIWQPGRRRAGSESHRGTLLIFKHHTRASFLLPPPPRPLSRHLVSLLSPRLSLLPARSRSSSPQFCLRFNFYPPHSSSSRWDPERTTPVMQDTLSFLFCTRLLFIWIWAHQFSMVSFIWTYFTSRIL